MGATPAAGTLHTVAEVACLMCEMKTKRRRYIAQLEREGTRLELTSFTTTAAKDREELERALADSQASTEARALIERQMAEHRAKLRQQVMQYRYIFDSRQDISRLTFTVPCPLHRLLVVQGADLTDALKRYGHTSELVVHAMRPHGV